MSRIAFPWPGRTQTYFCLRFRVGVTRRLERIAPLARVHFESIICKYNAIVLRNKIQLNINTSRIYVMRAEHVIGPTYELYCIAFTK